MQQISSRKTFFYKKVFPLLWFGIAGSVTVAMLCLPAKAGGPPSPFLLIPIAVMAFGYVLMKKLVFDLMDEVYDDGDRLIVKKDGVEETIPFANIINVGHSIAVNPARIILTLRTPGRFGKKIAFCPKVIWADVKTFGFTNRLADELVDRVDAARRSA